MAYSSEWRNSAQDSTSGVLTVGTVLQGNIAVTCSSTTIFFLDQKNHIPD